MTKSVAKYQPQPDGMTDGQAIYPGSGMPRRVCVKGMQGVDATVVVTVVRSAVWMCIMPPFTWEAMMEPEKVDEVIRTLESARREAERMGAALALSTREGRVTPSS